MWLLGGLAPDFKTIADFRKDNGKGIKNTCRTFIGLCREMNMFTDSIVAIDGSKFKAVNSKKNDYTPKKLQFHIERVKKHIDEYLKQLDDVDSEAEKTTDETLIKVKIDWLQKRLSELKAQDAGMTPLVPKGDTSGSEKKGIFNRSRFKYDTDRDVYICPANQVLPYRLTSLDHGMMQKRYWAHAPTCLACELRPQCSNSKQPRRTTRWEHQGQLDQMDALMMSMPDSMLIRKQTVEHPFGTIKSWMGSTHFLTRRLPNVSTEMSLHVLAYNLRRMMSILGPGNLIAAMWA
jgi:hypothetical protein